MVIIIISLVIVTIKYSLDLDELIDATASIRESYVVTINYYLLLTIHCILVIVIFRQKILRQISINHYIQ